MIEVTSLAKFYPGFKLHIEHFSIKKGQKVGIIGNNGVGKTTLLAAILDFITIDDGKVIINGIDNKSDKSKSFVSSYLDEKFLIGFLSVKEFLKFTSKMYKMDVSIYNKRLDFLEKLIPQPETKLIRQLSKGNQAKTGIVSCLLPDVPIYILDEPFANLDLKSRHQLAETLKLNFQRDTIIISSHEIGQLYNICDRFIIMEDGKIINDLNKSNVSEQNLVNTIIAQEK